MSDCQNHLSKCAKTLSYPVHWSVGHTPHPPPVPYATRPSRPQLTEPQPSKALLQALHRLMTFTSDIQLLASHFIPHLSPRFQPTHLQQHRRRKPTARSMAWRLQHSTPTHHHSALATPTPNFLPPQTLPHRLSSALPRSQLGPTDPSHASTRSPVMAPLEAQSLLELPLAGDALSGDVPDLTLDNIARPLSRLGGAPTQPGSPLDLKSSTPSDRAITSPDKPQVESAVSMRSNAPDPDSALLTLPTSPNLTAIDSLLPDNLICCIAKRASAPAIAITSSLPIVSTATTPRRPLPAVPCVSAPSVTITEPFSVASASNTPTRVMTPDRSSTTGESEPTFPENMLLNSYTPKSNSALVTLAKLPGPTVSEPPVTTETIPPLTDQHPSTLSPITDPTLADMDITSSKKKKKKKKKNIVEIAPPKTLETPFTSNSQSDFSQLETSLNHHPPEIKLNPTSQPDSIFFKELLNSLPDLEFKEKSREGYVLCQDPSPDGIEELGFDWNKNLIWFN